MANCEICGEPMPPGEEVFNYHGYSGPCPKPPLPRAPTPDPAVMRDYIDRLTRFFIDNAEWVRLANEARGYIGALDRETQPPQPEAKRAHPKSEGSSLRPTASAPRVLDTNGRHQ